MAVNPVVAKHLTEARRELVAERDRAIAEYDDEIAKIDSMLEGYAAPRDGSSINAAVTDEPAPPMKDAILEFLTSEDKAFTTNNIAVALNRRYGWQLSSTRSQVAKMGKAGDIHMLRRGVYESAERAARRLAAHLPEDTSAPDESGAEDSVPTTGAGGDSHAQADRDHGDHLADGDRDDRRGAPVGAATS